ncbi:unnamed protein product [Rhodiola kirilowii]
MVETDVIIASSPVYDGISCWELSTGEEILRYRGCASPPHGLICVGQRFLASSQLRNPNSNSGSGSVLYWSWTKPQAEVRSFTAEPIKPLVSNTDGTYIIGGGSYGNIYLWEVATGKLLRKWNAHYERVTSLVWLEDQSLLVSGSDDGLVRVRPFDDEQWEEAERLQEHKHSLSCHNLPVTDIVCSVVGHTTVIVSAFGNSTCKVWNISANSSRTILFPTIIKAIAVHPGHEMFYAGGRDGTIYSAALSAESSSGETHGMPINGSLPNYQKAIRCLAFDSKGVLLISGLEDGTIRVWDIKARNIVRDLKHSKGPVDNIFVVSSRRHDMSLPPPLGKYAIEDTPSDTVVSLAKLMEKLQLHFDQQIMHSSVGSKETLRELLIKANSCLSEFSGSGDYELREKLVGWKAQMETDDYARSQCNSNSYLGESSATNSSEGSKETIRGFLMKANKGFLPFSNSDDYKLRAEMLALEAQLACEDYARSQRNSQPYLEESFCTKSSEGSKETLLESLIKANRGLIPFTNSDDHKLRAEMLALEARLASEDYTQLNSHPYLEESSATKSSKGSKETLVESLIKANRGLIPFSNSDDYKLRERMLTLEAQLACEDYARSQRNSQPSLEESSSTISNEDSEETLLEWLIKANRGLIPFSNSDDCKLRARMLALEAQLASED